MATIIILLGGILGFGTAITAHMAFGASLATALVIWAASGPLSALVAAFALMAKRPAAADPARDAPHRLQEVA
jgi:hypothetical protein